MRLYQRGAETFTGKGRSKRPDPRPWWVAYTLNGDHFRQSLKTRDREVAEARAAELRREIRMRELGIETFSETRTICLEDLVTAYELELRRMGRVRGHVETVTKRVLRLLGTATALSQVTPQRVSAALQVVSDGGLSPKTVNEYRSALHSFYAWLVRTGQWGSNPVAAVARQADHEPTRRRRALTEDELRLLVEHAGRDRGVVYLTAARTGLRRGELRGWRWRDIDIEGRVFRVRASVSKDRREATLPLDAGVAEALHTGRRTLDPNQAVFRTVPTMPTLRRDLEASGIPYETAEGFADFHALRHTFNTHLARAGVSLALRQHLMRHSDPKLTAGVYLHLELDDARRALDVLVVPATGAAAVIPARARL